MRMAEIVYEVKDTVICNCKSCKHSVEVPHRKLPLCIIGPEYQIDCIRDSFEHWESKHQLLGFKEVPDES